MVRPSPRNPLDAIDHGTSQIEGWCRAAVVGGGGSPRRLTSFLGTTFALGDDAVRAELERFVAAAVPPCRLGLLVSVPAVTFAGSVERRFR